jgi:hypothetical protein
MFVIFRNNLNRFWDFYHGTNLGVGSSKAASPRQKVVELSK